MKFRFVHFLPAIGWFLLSFYLLTLPGSSLPTFTWFDAIYGDKFVHIGMFLVMVLLFLFPFRNTRTGSSLLRISVMIALTALCYGIAMEYVQKYFIPHRSFDVGDMVADGIGSFIPVIWLSVKQRNKAVAKKTYEKRTG